MIINNQVQYKKDFYESLSSNISLNLTTESTCRKICRLAFASFGATLSYATLIPSVLTANSFNPFPGARQISAAAVIITFGTFGASNYLDLSRILFRKPDSNEKRSSIARTTKVILSILLGIASRLPGAGVALKIAPGIPNEWKLPLAIFGILGTCSPEIVSTYNTFDDFVKCCCHTENAGSSTHDKETIIRHLQNVKHQLLQLTDSERRVLIQHLNSMLESFEGGEKKISEFFDPILNQHNYHVAPFTKKQGWPRKVVHILIGTATSLGTCCSLIQNTVLTKLAFDYFIPNDAAWKWVPSTICALSIAHTTFKTSYVAARQCFDSAASFCESKSNTKFSEVFYPKIDWIISLFSAFWSFALFGIFMNLSILLWEWTIGKAKCYLEEILSLHFSLFIE